MSPDMIKLEVRSPSGSGIPHQLLTHLKVSEDYRRHYHNAPSGPIASNITTISPNVHHDLQLVGDPSQDGSVSRSRLPPRSRTGCWTCRTRKVKCDEKRPKCGQCTRLQHHCDYSPRLSFRDDTHRIMDRMHEISVVGSIVWDPKISHKQHKGECPVSPPVDGRALPRFADLTNDEDRELKALGEKPGTYYIIYTPDSFANSFERENMNEDGDYDPTSIFTSRTDSASHQAGRLPGIDWDSKFTLGQSEEKDPNTVILRCVEDPAPSRKASIHLSPSRTRRSIPHTPTGCGSNLEVFDITHIPKRRQVSPPLCTDDAKYLEFYRKHISSRVMKTHDGSLSRSSTETPDAFEKESKISPSLFHAIVALSALFLSAKRSIKNIHALKHYQLSLPTLMDSLRKPQDLTCNGTLFTHYFLLLYEIAASEHSRECIWQQHLTQLLSIVVTRAEMNGKERLPFLIWNLVVIDVYAALTAGGDGEFVETLLKHKLIPNPADMIPQMAVKTEEIPAQILLFHDVLVFKQRVVLQAAALARLARKFRWDNTDFTDRSYREQKVLQFNVELRTLWETYRPQCIQAITINNHISSSTHPRVQELFEHAMALYNVCMIFANTSLWPQQRKGLSPATKHTVQVAIGATASQSAALSAHTYLNREFMLFPLFLASIMAEAYADKIWFKDAMRGHQNTGIGYNIHMASTLLESIIEKQCGIEYWTNGHMEEVDWLRYIFDMGYRTVIWEL